MATPSRTVQFRSIDDVMEAYLNREVAPWAIFAGTQFMFSYSGDSLEQGRADLEAILKKLEDNQSAAIYTLCIYEDLGKNGKIKSNTPNDGSFNFRLHEHTTNYIPGVAGGRFGLMQQDNKVLIDEIRALRMEVQKIKEQQDTEIVEDDEPEDDIMGKIGRIIENPALQPLITGIIGKITELLTPKSQLPGTDENILRKVSGIPGSEKDLKISEAVEILAETVPDLGDMLMKLATMSKSKPQQFKIFLTMLRSMK
jgi:hypothetical protein